MLIPVNIEQLLGAAKTGKWIVNPNIGITVK